MYSTNSLNGIPTIQRDGHNVLAVWDQDWELATQISELLNEFETKSREPKLVFTQDDKRWLKAMDLAFREKAKHM